MVVGYRDGNEPDGGQYPAFAVTLELDGQIVFWAGTGQAERAALALENEWGADLGALYVADPPFGEAIDDWFLEYGYQPPTRAILEERHVVYATLTGVPHGPVGIVALSALLIAFDGDASAGAAPQRVTILMPVVVVGWEQIDSTRQIEGSIRALAYAEAPDPAWWEAPGDGLGGFLWLDAADCQDIKNRCDFHCARALVNCLSGSASPVGWGAAICLTACGLAGVVGGFGALPCVAACLGADAGFGLYGGHQCWNMAKECYGGCGFTYDVCTRSINGPAPR